MRSRSCSWRAPRRTGLPQGTTSVLSASWNSFESPSREGTAFANDRPHVPPGVALGSPIGPTDLGRILRLPSRASGTDEPINATRRALRGSGRGRRTTFCALAQLFTKCSAGVQRSKNRSTAILRAVDGDDQEQRAPQHVVLQARVAQVRVGNDCDDVEDEERERREARAEPEDQQDRQAELGRGPEQGRNRRRQQRDVILVLEERECNVRVPRCWMPAWRSTGSRVPAAAAGGRSDGMRRHRSGRRATAGTNRWTTSRAPWRGMPVSRRPPR